MSDAAIFATVFVSIFVLRIVAATLVFYWILPQTDRCPNCNAVTLRMQSRGLQMDALASILLVHRLRLERHVAFGTGQRDAGDVRQGIDTPALAGARCRTLML